MKKIIVKHPFILIPLIIVQVGLMVGSLIHIYTHKKYRTGNRVIWTILSFVNFIGPIMYFIIGKEEDRRVLEDDEILYF